MYEQPSGADVLKQVHDAYSSVALQPSDSARSKKVAKAFGYTDADHIDDTNMGLGCGNPVAFASIREGENILDLGSGGGIDVLLSAKIIGPKGQAIGLDMSMNMIERARANAKRRGIRSPNVSFVHAQLSEPLPIASDSIDCIISNCVINLLPLASKANIFKEAFRVLKPGGRIAFDDIISLKPQSEDIKKSLALYVGCISGSVLREEYERFLHDASFVDTAFKPTGGDLNVYKEVSESSCCGPASTCCEAPEAFPQMVSDIDFNQWAGAFHIYAVKPDIQDKIVKPALEPLLQWWDAYPVAKSSPSLLLSDDLAKMITEASPDFAVIDVRRNDFKGYKVKSAVQRPAQSFYDDLDPFYAEFGKYKKVIFYCSSSRGCGSRCVAWYQDYLAGLGEESENATAVFVLAGGIKGFEADYPFLTEKIQE